MIRLPAALLLIAATSAQVTATEIYKYRDAQGHVVYSDRPQDGAERIDISETNTTPAVDVQERPEKKPEPFTGYEISISSPADEAVIPNGLAPLDVQVSLQPALREGDGVRLMVDGQVFDESAGTHFTIPRLSRGSHTLQAEALVRGQPAGRSAPVNLFVYWPGGN